MGVTRDEIAWLYRCILGREPESDAAIEGHQYTFPLFNSARLAFIASAEFGEFYEANILAKRVYYKPPLADSNPKRPKTGNLALAVIVKNEERRISRLLQASADLVDFVAIVDAMSTDSTVRIAQQVLSAASLPFVLVSQPFVDFATARNEAVSLVPDNYEWILMLDADELIPSEDFDKLRDLMDISDFDAWTLPRYNFIDAYKAKAPANYPDPQARLFRKSSGAKFKGRVHEYLANVDRIGHAPEALPTSDFVSRAPHIHHLTVLDATPEDARAKAEFYDSLIAGRADIT